MMGVGPRCSMGLAYDDKATRCFLRAGHSGPHKARDRKTNPYVTLRWFNADARTFLTTRNAEWAWTARVRGNGMEVSEDGNHEAR